MPETDRRLSRARDGEEATARAYERRGYRSIARNWRCAIGELDLVLQRGGTLVFCEVKTRTGMAFGGGFEAVTWSKRRKLRRLADAFMQSYRSHGVLTRFDVASVWLGPRGPDVEIFEDAF